MGEYATIIHDFSPKENHPQVDFLQKKPNGMKKTSAEQKSYDWEDENSQAGGAVESGNSINSGFSLEPFPRMCYDKRGSVNNMEQFSRTISLVGQSAFDRVHQARVAVFGIGGVGGYVCEALVRSGIAEIDLFDRDDVSISNLNRQIIALHSTIGQDKVDAMAARLKDINPDVRVNCRKMFYLPTNADEIDLSVYDFVVDAVDTVAAKLELARRCEQGGIRFISAMGAGNKLDPSCLRIADITKTSVCPLARAMRVSCKKKGIRHMTVAYSLEPMHPPVQPIAEESGRRKDIPGSTAFVPGAMGLLIASHVVRTLMAGDEPARPEG